MIPASWKIYLDAFGVLAFIVVALLIVHHLEGVGVAKQQAADAQQALADHAKMLETQSQWQAQADKAEATRDATQKQLDDYRTANPIGHVLVCRNQGVRPAGLPQAAGANTGNGGAGTGSASVPEVPDGSSTIDIGSPLDTIVHAAATLGGLYRQYQQQPQAQPVK